MANKGLHSRVTGKLALEGNLPVSADGRDGHIELIGEVGDAIPFFNTTHDFLTLFRGKAASIALVGFLDWSTYRFPDLALCDVRNGCIGDVVIFCNGLQGIPPRSAGSNLHNILFGEFGRGVFGSGVISSQILYSVLDVFLWCYVLQVFRAVVLAVAIEVVHLQAQRARSYKSGGYQPMNSASFRFFVQSHNDLQVAAPVCDRAKWYALAVLPEDKSGIGNSVARKTGDWSDFHTHVVPSHQAMPDASEMGCKWH